MIRKMIRLALWGVTGKRREIIEELHRLGVLHLEQGSGPSAGESARLNTLRLLREKRWAFWNLSAGMSGRPFRKRASTIRKSSFRPCRLTSLPRKSGKALRSSGRDSPACSTKEQLPRNSSSGQKRHGISSTAFLPSSGGRMADPREKQRCG